MHDHFFWSQHRKQLCKACIKGEVAQLLKQISVYVYKIVTNKQIIARKVRMKWRLQMAKKRYFALVAHCLFNPSTRVHMLGRRFCVAEKVADYFLSKHIAVIQLPCPEFTAMGYWRNPQGRQQYDNTFFRKHCRQSLESYVDMVVELVANSNTPLCFMGIQGSPTCSIYWGKHKQNRYKTESMEEDPKAPQDKTMYGVMTSVLDEMLREHGIEIPYVEAPVKENITSERTVRFFKTLDRLVGIPKREQASEGLAPQVIQAPAEEGQAYEASHEGYLQDDDVRYKEVTAYRTYEDMQEDLQAAEQAYEATSSSAYAPY